MRGAKMLHLKRGLFGLCIVVLGAMAMTASAAQGALSWLILNKAKTEATSLKATLVAKTDSTHLTWEGEVAGLKVAVTCTGVTFKGLSLEIGNKITEGGSAVFTGCKVFKTSPLAEEYKCSIHSPGAAIGTSETGQLKGELVLLEGEVQLRIEPIAGPTGNWKTFRFEGSECPLPELNQMHGTIYLKDFQGFATTHKLEHLLEVVVKSTALYVGGHSTKQLEVTKLLGSVWAGLAGAHSGLEWAGMDA
jgi:hypothetical protein